MQLKDTKTGKTYELDFTWFCFPGMENEGYRVEGTTKDGEHKEFGSIIISDGQLKIVNW